MADEWNEEALQVMVKAGREVLRLTGKGVIFKIPGMTKRWHVVSNKTSTQRMREMERPHA